MLPDMAINFPGIQGGAPIQESGDNPSIIADANFVVPSGSQVYSSIPTAGRAWTLPALATCSPGTVIVVKNNSAAQTITVSPAAGELINEAGAAVAIAGTLAVSFIARRALLTPVVAASWVSIP